MSGARVAFLFRADPAFGLAIPGGPLIFAVMMRKTLVILLCACAPAGLAAAELRYQVTLAGLPLMALALDLNDRGVAYRANITARADGAADFVAQVRGEEAKATRLYRIEISGADWHQRTVVETGAGASPRRIDPEPRHGATVAAAGAIDPVKALVEALRAAGRGRCPADVTVFDGWRNITIHFIETATDGVARICRFQTDAAISGDDPISRLLGAGEARFVDLGDGRADIQTLRFGPALFGLVMRRISTASSSSDEKDPRDDRL